MKARYFLLALAILTLPVGLLAQEDSTDIFDYSQFGDAADVKRYATQKVLNQSPTKLVSVGLEWQGGSMMEMATRPGDFEGGYRIRSVVSPRVAANFPVVSTDKWILNLGGQYWGSLFSVTREAGGQLAPAAGYLDRHMHHSLGMLATVFKPLDEKHFILGQLGVDYNSAFPPGSYLTARALTLSASAVYGWKTGERKMWGLGASRTYRLGRIIHVPILMWNQTFNDRWGTEILLPARAFVRRNFSPRSMLLMGFELEGNQYWLPGLTGAREGLYLQRGEIKPRLQWERQLKNFIWLSAQAGARINGRFNFTDRYYGREEHEIVRTTLKPAPYFNVSLNLVSP